MTSVTKIDIGHLPPGHETEELAGNLAERLNLAYEEMSKDAGRFLYGDPPDFKPPTVVGRVRAFFGRIPDAWAVLCGRADIC